MVAGPTGGPVSRSGLVAKTVYGSGGYFSA